MQLQPCTASPSSVDIISALGATLTTLVSLYLVHRRILADRVTKYHRDEESVIHQKVVEKLGVELADAKKKAEPEC